MAIARRELVGRIGLSKTKLCRSCQLPTFMKQADNVGGLHTYLLDLNWRLDLWMNVSSAGTSIGCLTAPAMFALLAVRET